MPRYTHDPSRVQATIAILSKAEYEFEIGQPKPFERTAKKGHQSYGIRFPITVVSAQGNGKRTVYTCYLHSDGAAGMTKQFQMAVCGFEVKQENEQEFDEKYAGDDWSFNPETGEIGEAWQKFKGAHVVNDLDVEMRKQDPDDPNSKEVENQVWGTWRPV